MALEIAASLKINLKPELVRLRSRSVKSVSERWNYVLSIFDSVR